MTLKIVNKISSKGHSQYLHTSPSSDTDTRSLGNLELLKYPTCCLNVAADVLSNNLKTV